jgi:hypothetical protein
MSRKRIVLSYLISTGVFLVVVISGGGDRGLPLLSPLLPFLLGIGAVTESLEVEKGSGKAPG